MVKTSAPGKVHLIGEHAIVYGEPAILASVGLRTYIEAERSDGIRFVDRRFDSRIIECDLEEARRQYEHSKSLWQACSDKRDFSEMLGYMKEGRYSNYYKTLIGKTIDAFNFDDGVEITVSSEIPIGAGIGSSAAYSVALVKALSELSGKHIVLDKINEIAYELERFIHGTPSGGDNSACCYGGLIWFKKQMPKNEIKSLRNEIPYKLDNFVLVYTKPPVKSTGELVQQVRNLDEDYRNERVRGLGRMTHEMLEVLRQKDFERMKELINRTQQNLAELGVSTKEIDEIASAVMEIGGAAKLCGAGGGGIMLCYHEDVIRLSNLISDLGYKPLSADLAVEGVRRE